MPEPKTPMLDKISAVHKITQPLGEFLDWLHEDQGIKFMRESHLHGTLHVPFEVTPCEEPCDGLDGHAMVLMSTQELLARFFDIDLVQAGVEREAVLDYHREQRNEHPDFRE